MTLTQLWVTSNCFCSDSVLGLKLMSPSAGIITQIWKLHTQIIMTKLKISFKGLNSARIKCSTSYSNSLQQNIRSPPDYLFVNYILCIFCLSGDCKYSNCLQVRTQIFAFRMCSTETSVKLSSLTWIFALNNVIYSENCIT